MVSPRTLLKNRAARLKPVLDFFSEQMSLPIDRFWSSSSTWLKGQTRDCLDFQWQGGYADFGVSQSNLEQVTRYIANQEKHHKKMSFQDELHALLRKHNLEWDERYLWD